MELDAQAQQVMDQLGKYAAPPLESLTPEAARCVPLLDYAARDLVALSAGKRLVTVAMPMPEPVGGVQHRAVAGPGGERMLRIYTPSGAEGPELLPVLVYFHGGGWVIAGLDQYDASARALANAAQCIVVSVAYRQAPEHKYPAAAEDAYFATQWVMENAQMFGGDPLRVAVGGESAGGNLATVACLMTRERGGQMPVHQLLVYPVTNFGFDSPSYKQYADAKPLNAAMMRWFWGHYLRDAADGMQPYASPLRAPNLTGMPAATLVTAEIDPLRDDGMMYAHRLQESGVVVHQHHYEGVMHEFFGLSGLLDKAQDAVKKAAEDLKRSFSPDKGGTIPQPVGQLTLDGMPA